VTRNDRLGQTTGIDVGLYFSYDDGLTWPDRKGIALPTAHTDETALMWLGGMTLIGFNRSAVSPYGPLYFIKSSDLGATWTVNTANWPCGPIPAGESGCTSEQVDPVLITPNLPTPNLQTLFFGDRLSTSAGGRPIIRTLTFDQNAAISSPTGFGIPTQVFNGGLGPNPNFSCYSAAVQISPTTVLVEFMQPSAPGMQSNLYFMTATYAGP